MGNFRVWSFRKQEIPFGCGFYRTHDSREVFVQEASKQAQNNVHGRK